MSAALRAHVGDGRFIIYDPDQFETSQLYELGQTDLNIFAGPAQRPGLHRADRRRLLRRHRRPLPGGPRSVDPGRRHLGRSQRHHPALAARATSSPLSPRPAPGPTVPADAVQFPGEHRLLQLVADPGGRLLRPVERTGPRPGTSEACSTVGSVDRPAAGRAARRPPGRPGDRHRRRPLAARRRRHRGPVGRAHLAPGRPCRPGPGRPGSSSSRWAPARSTVGTPTAFTAQTGEVALDGRMQYGVTPPHWAFTGTLGSFGVFHNTEARGWAWVELPGRGPARGRAARSTAPAPAENGDQQVTVHATCVGRARPQRVVEPGLAGHRPARGAARPATRPPDRPATVPVVRIGVNQGVDLPGPGRLPGDLLLPPGVGRGRAGRVGGGGVGPGPVGRPRAGHGRRRRRRGGRAGTVRPGRRTLSPG